MASTYRVELAPAAQRQARRLITGDARRVRAALRKLVQNPRPTGSIKLSGFASVWRIRIGGFRVVYEISDDKRLVVVLRISKRDEQTYRRIRDAR